MGRKKSDFHSRDKVMHKISVQCQAKSRSAKKPNQNKKEPEEVDSLMFLKNSRSKKEVNGLDEKIKLLKSELKMLLGDSEFENGPYKCVSDYENGLGSQELLLDKNNQKKPLFSKSKTETVGIFNLKEELPGKHLLTKFSKCLNKTIDDMTVKCQNQTEFFQCNDLFLNSTPQKSLTPEKSSPFQSSSKLKVINPSTLSQQKVEQLLYQSFYLQNFEVYLSSSDENDPDQIKSTKALKQQKKKIRKSSKLYKEKFYESNLKSYYKSTPKVRRKRAVAKSSSKTNMDLRHKSVSNNGNVIREKNVDFVELDVTNYDWSEPFEIDEQTGVYSDVEILENPGEERTYKNEEKKKSNSGSVECDLNATDDKHGEDQLKAGWECPICFERSKGQEVVATQCGHVFCKKCLECHMSKFSKNCPTCRTDLSSKPFITLFNF